MQKFLIKLLLISIINSYVFNIEKLKAFIPSYYQPSTKSLKRESLLIGKQAYQLLYFGQIKESLSLAKLAVKLNKSDETLWTILGEAQIANQLYKDALISLENAQKINPNMGEIYFAKSTIFLKLSKIKEAKDALKKGVKILPKNFRGIFQLGNIYLMEKNYEKAIGEFDKAVKIKADFWQAINNKGLAYFELDKINFSIMYFKKAIALEENAETLLALASCLQNQDINKSISLTKKVLIKEPNYVAYDYRKEQLWGEKLQNSTKRLFENPQLLIDVALAKTKINKTS